MNAAEVDMLRDCVDLYLMCVHAFKTGKFVRELLIHKGNKAMGDSMAECASDLTELSNLLPALYRNYLRGPRINIERTSLVGFDTEYISINERKNRLVSVQL